MDNSSQNLEHLKIYKIKCNGKMRAVSDWLNWILKFKIFDINKFLQLLILFSKNKKLNLKSII